MKCTTFSVPNSHLLKSFLLTLRKSKQRVQKMKWKIEIMLMYPGEDLFFVM